MRIGSKSVSLAMRAAMTQLNLSARAYHRILKLARTISDLAGSEESQSAHLAEALHALQPAEVDVELNLVLIFFPVFMINRSFLSHGQALVLSAMVHVSFCIQPIRSSASI